MKYICLIIALLFSCAVGAVEVLHIRPKTKQRVFGMIDPIALLDNGGHERLVIRQMHGQWQKMYTSGRGPSVFGKPIEGRGYMKLLDEALYLHGSYFKAAIIEKPTLLGKDLHEMVKLMVEDGIHKFWFPDYGLFVNETTLRRELLGLFKEYDHSVDFGGKDAAYGIRIIAHDRPLVGVPNQYMRFRQFLNEAEK